MSSFVLLMLAATGFYLANAQQQRQRIGWLGGMLARYQIEKLIENLLQGYLRALDETDAERQRQVWQHLYSVEDQLSDQLGRFAQDLASAMEQVTRVSLLPLAVPYGTTLFPKACFDFRRAVKIHADGLAGLVAQRGELQDKARAYTLTAEILLFQHTCHWFCRSKTVASARMLARHKTSHEQVLAAVTPATLAAYQTLVQRQ
ncbi:MAG: hypothetical protein RL323_1632 [Pseudomonadota bacterium]